MVKIRPKKQLQKTVEYKTSVCLSLGTRDRLRVVKNKNKIQSMDSAIKFLLKNQKKQVK